MKGIFSKETREAIKRADLIVAQGKLMNWAIGFLGKKLIEKNPGESLLMQLIKGYEKTGKSFFFVGGTRDIINECVIRLKKSFPYISIRGQFPKEILKAREKDVREVIRKTRPDLILVGLGKGKDEKWIKKNIKHFEKGVCLGIKDGILISAGVVKQPSLWIKDRGWQPFVKLLKRPWRILGIFKLLLFYMIIIKNKIFGR
jgi:N-acetylglucosaminyldiphosphoundecaprenol N-acetyl-beta-D-mannosaminyltransferase